MDDKIIAMFCSAPHHAGLGGAPGHPSPAEAWAGRRPQRERVVEDAPKVWTVLEVAGALPTAAWTRQTIKEGSQGAMVTMVELPQRTRMVHR